MVMDLGFSTVTIDPTVWPSKQVDNLRVLAANFCS